MKNILKYLWRICSIIATVWLFFTLFSITVWNKSDKTKVYGEVIKIHTHEWNGIKETNALVETEDGKGVVQVRVYSAGLNVGDRVSVDINTGRNLANYMHASISR